MTINKAASAGIRLINGTVNLVILTVILLLIAFAGYALWDSNQVIQSADSTHYAIYKPTAENEGRSFQELQALNPEVIAWLTVYGTNIDYPVTQGPDNMKYVNTGAEGQYSLAGAVFLDYRNNKNFTDFNNILFGHNMAGQTMFGQVGDFRDKSIFDSHPYGNLYFNGKNHGIEFFAFVHTNAYDNTVLTPNILGSEQQQSYLDNLLEKAINKRDIGITVHDNIILLNTCSAHSTNGRDILIGRITDSNYEPLPDEATDVVMPSNPYEDDGEVIPIFLWWLLIIMLLMLSGIYVFVRYRQPY